MTAESELRRFIFAERKWCIQLISCKESVSEIKLLLRHKVNEMQLGKCGSSLFVFVWDLLFFLYVC